MSKGHYTGTCAPSSMRTGPGPVAGAGMVKMAANSRIKTSGGKASGLKMTVGTSKSPKGMKYQRSGE